MFDGRGAYEFKKIDQDTVEFGSWASRQDREQQQRELWSTVDSR